MYQKPPKLIELHEELFEETPKNLHNSMTDVYVTFRCFHKMVYKMIYSQKNLIIRKRQYNLDMPVVCKISIYLDLKTNM